MRMATTGLWLACVAVAAGCGADGAVPCTSGQTIVCPCPGGSMGTQTCQASGTFAVCACDGADVGPQDVGTDATTDLGRDGAVGADNGPDARVEDITPTDLGVDTATDLGGTDLGVDAGTDLGAPTDLDTGTDLGVDTGTEPGFDIGVADVGSDRGGADLGAEATVDVPVGCTSMTPSNCCGVSCAIRPNTLATCDSGVCGSLCAPGFGDCDGNPATGCEAPLTTAANCGACGTACARTNAAATCATGACAIGACNAGFADCDGSDADGCETPLRTTANCGACGATCSRANASPSCSTGACSIGACNPGFDSCDGNDANGCETSLLTLTSCGACGTSCARANATASCASGACRTQSCSAGFGDCDANDANGCESPLNTPAHCGTCGTVCGARAECVAGGCVVVAAPRLVAPLSTARVTSRRPLLRWSPVAGSLGTRVQICHDRACATVLASIDTVGASATPSADLPTGVVYWRAYGRVGAVLGSVPSPTWQMVVGARSAAINVSAGSVFDANGDGYADLTVGALCAAATGLSGCGSGRVHVYMGAAGGIGASAARSLSGSDVPNGYFGGATSTGDLNGDGYADLVVGAGGANSFRGRTYVYPGGAGGVGSAPSVVLNGPQDNGVFGGDVASAGDLNGDGYADLVVGAPGSVFSVLGGAYVYPGGAGGVASLGAPIAPPEGGHFGTAVAVAGDVNGDGYADVVIGASSAASEAGRAYVYLGSASGIGASPSVTLSPPGGGANSVFGHAVASAGDVNGDGYTDILVGASGSFSNVGRAYLYLGSAGGIGTTPSLTLPPPIAASNFGSSVESLGDLNNDGYGDIGVGASQTMFVYLGSPDGGLQVFAPIVLLRPDPADDSFGSAFGGLGDVNGDGFADLAVGASGYSSLTGRAYVYLGRASGLVATPAQMLTAPDGIYGRFGSSVVTREVRRAFVGG